MKKLIADASPLIFLAKGGLLNALEKVCKKVYVTKWIMIEIEKPIEMKIKAPEIEMIKSRKILCVEPLDAKEVMNAKKLAEKLNIGMGEAEAAILFKRGHYDSILVADDRAQKKMKEIGISTIDPIDLAFAVAETHFMNPRQFALKLWNQAHFRSERVRNLLGKPKKLCTYR